MSMRVDWSGDLEGGIDRWWSRVEGRLPAAMEQAGGRMIAFARVGHPWQNQTGAAEAGLVMEVKRVGDTFVLEFGHTVFYGVYLERRWGGRWGIVPQTIAMGAPLVMQAALSALRG